MKTKGAAEEICDFIITDHVVIAQDFCTVRSWAFLAAYKNVKVRHVEVHVESANLRQKIARRGFTIKIYRRRRDDHGEVHPRHAAANQ